MKKSVTDILSDRLELKQMPYTTPAGYFDGLKHDLKETSCPAGHGFRKFAPYVALAAAMLALLFAAGGFFMEHMNTEEFTQEDYIVFSEDMTNTLFYTMEEEYEQYADALTEDDIIEYLIYTDTEIDELY